MTLRKQLAAVTLTGALALGGVAAASPASAHSGHHVGPIGSKHYISLYVYEQPYGIDNFNPFNPFCWGASSIIKTVDARTGSRTRNDFKRCW